LHRHANEDLIFRVKIKKVTVRNFRNLAPQTIELNPRINYLVGPNGQGKTNFLEAIYFVTCGKSFRTSKLEHLFQNDQSDQETKAQVSAQILRGDFDDLLEIYFDRRTRSSLVNGKKQSSTNPKLSFPVIVFSPESLSAIKEGPEIRRQLLNELLLTHHSEHRGLLNDFLHSLRTRNRILRDFSTEKIPRSRAEDLLESVNPRYFELAAQVTFYRYQALQRIFPIFEATLSSLIHKPDVNIRVEYVSSIPEEAFADPKAIVDALRNRGSQLRSAELASGASLVGPQKHDVNFWFANKDARYFCSQGQQRALILSLKISEIVYHKQTYNTYPILLMDDVLSELDAEKRQYLINFLQGSESQTFLTSTDYSFSADERPGRITLFSVFGGVLTPQT
jgi:DNA replication and repair protein RecF